jgi:tRNA pseudouridine38-40 synthase
MLDNLDPSVALKVDDLILLNREEVKKYLELNSSLIEKIKFTDHATYHMDYGYNQFNNPVKIAYHEGKIQRIIIKTKDYSLKRLKLIVSYDGSNYHGFQIQEKEKTIQGELSNLISEVNNKEILVQGSSRTDAGVHAINQVIHFDDSSNLSPDEWVKFLNHRLPKDIFVKDIEITHPLFHSRYDVFEKEYLYQIKLGDFNPFLLRYTWEVEYLDFIRLDNQLKKIIGTFDFSSFAKGLKGDNTRTIYDAGYKLDDDILKIYIRGNGFLRYMVRLIINHVINFAIRKTDIDILDIIKEKSRTHTKDLAPAAGLYLNKINY